MTRDELTTAWFAAKEPRRLEESDLVRRGAATVRGRTYLLYDCPCGGDGHDAMRGFEEGGLSRWPSAVINCFVTGRQWLVRPVDVAAVIKDEEGQYLRLLERAPAIVNKAVKRLGLTEATFAFLKDTHGLDRDIVEEVLRCQNTSSA